MQEAEERCLRERTDLFERLARVRLLAMDVDGVLTDGILAYSGQGDALKRFHVADGLGLVVLRQAGVQIAWISGRADAAVTRRAAELRIETLRFGVRDKGRALSGLIAEFGFTREETTFIGDDWNDLPAFAVAGVRLAVANAAVEVKARADAVTQARGGAGAVREVCEALLAARGILAQSLEDYLKSLAESDSMEGAEQ